MKKGTFASVKNRFTVSQRIDDGDEGVTIYHPRAGFFPSINGTLIVSIEEVLNKVRGRMKITDIRINYADFRAQQVFPVDEKFTWLFIIGKELK